MIRSVLRTVTLIALAILVVTPSVDAGDAMTAAEIQGAIDMAGVDPGLWKAAANDLAMIVDRAGRFLNVATVMQSPAFQKMIPEADRQKLALLMPQPVQREHLLLAIAAWAHGALDEMLERKPESWWSPGGGNGPCACAWVVDRECCARAMTCQWQGGFCGCR